MIAGWGAERFDSVLAGTGGINQFVRLMHAFPIAANEKGEMIPGVASDWSISEDGLTWTVTVRDGVQFHDGSPLTAEDVLWTWNHEFGLESNTLLQVHHRPVPGPGHREDRADRTQPGERRYDTNRL
jgi:ABC-type transport system substrate-binding protein